MRPYAQLCVRFCVSREHRIVKSHFMEIEQKGALLPRPE